MYGTKTKISSHKWFCEDIFSKFIFMKIFFPFLKLSPVSILTSLQKISCLCQSSSNCGYFPFLITPQINSKLPLASHYFLTPFLLESVLSVHLKWTNLSGKDYLTRLHRYINVDIFVLHRHEPKIHLCREVHLSSTFKTFQIRHIKIIFYLYDIFPELIYASLIPHPSLAKASYHWCFLKEAPRYFLYILITSEKRISP